MSTTKYAGGSETQTKIDKLQKLIDSPSTPESDKKNFQEALKKFKEKLASETKANATEKPKPTTTVKTVAKKTVAKKPMTIAKPKITAKTTVKKIPKGVQMASKKTVVVNGKAMSTDSQEFCDYLTSEFLKRKEKAKTNKASRKKTKSVMAQVSTKIEQGVEKAIKTSVSKQKPTLKKNPQVFIGKVEKLETATKNFLTQLKEVLGNDYDAKEVTDTTKAIHKLIEDLKKKYGKK